MCDKLIYHKSDGTPRRPRQSALSSKDRFFMTLVRLRRAVPIKDLAACFEVSMSFASTVTYTWIRFLGLQFQVLSKRMFVGTAAQNVNKLPAFKRFRNLRVIIDCAEFKIQKSKNFQMQSNTWSTYKSDNTVKYLFGMSTYTGASFVSRGCEGSMSDKEVTEVSGFYDHLVPGDKVMCDRGFDIEPELNQRGVGIIRPAFLGKRDALTALEIRESQDVSSSRIFVEILIKKSQRFQNSQIQNLQQTFAHTR